MNPSCEPIDPGRRSLLKLGLLGSALLVTAGAAATLSSCSASSVAHGFRVLRDEDMAFLRAVIPVILAGAVAPGKMPEAVSGTLESIDTGLSHVSPAMLKLSRQLFDVSSSTLTRGPLTGVWGAWQHADATQVEQFLLRWRDSSLDLFKQGHSALLQMVLMAFYSRPTSWVHCGYPGPPPI